MAVLNDSTIRVALANVGQHLRLDHDVEILVVGGAAGLLIGELPPAWTTADVDVMHCKLPQDRDAVLLAAEQAGRELSLPPSWMSEDGGIYEWTLPQGWEARRVMVGTFYRLRVFAISRMDLITMKFIAHRERDLEHLARMNVTHQEREFVLHQLDSLLQHVPEEIGRIEMARQYVEQWEART